MVGSGITNPSDTPMGAELTPRSGSVAREFILGFRGMLRTQFALILREARVRHGRSRIGYAWAVLEPFAVLSVMTLFFAGLTRSGPLDPEFALFYATGVLPFQYFRHASAFVGMSIEANTPLFNYPSVREFDAALARLTLDTITSLVICTLVFTFLTVIFDLRGPAHLGTLFISFFGLGLLALGIGLNVAALQRRFQMAHHVYNMVTTPAFFLSCIFFSLTSVPPHFRDYLVWNPLVHGIEGFRIGYFPDYSDTYVSLGYLYFVGLTLLFLGMLQLLLSRRGLL